MTERQADEDVRRQRFGRVASLLLWFFAVCFAAGALQVVVALHSQRIWRNYRGEPVSVPTMRHELLFLIIAALLAALAAWHWHRGWARPGRAGGSRAP
jgi:cytochrome bd-type quinol oxidase subunit 2